jgi:hypothetical protein
LPAIPGRPRDYDGALHFGNLAITEQCDYFEKCGSMFFDPAVYLIFKFHPDLIITDPAAFTNALNFCGIFHA